MRCPVFIVTGATSGIGAAITARLAASQRRVLAVGRNTIALDALRSRLGSLVEGHALDLCDEAALEEFAARVAGDHPQLDGLVHCAGINLPERLGAVTTANLDHMLNLNFRAPFLLTNRLVEPLAAAGGTLVFLNSSVGLRATPGRSAYVASKFALRGFADAARLDLNERGVRVASIYPGRTATPGLAELVAGEGGHYDADALLQPEFVADAVLGVIDAPANAEITDIALRPRTKSY